MVSDILQPTHLLFVLVIALLVLGPKRLPEVGRALGRGLRDFKNALNTDDMHEQMISTTNTQTNTPMSQQATEVPETPLATEAPNFAGEAPNFAGEAPTATSSPVDQASPTPDPTQAVAGEPTAEPVTPPREPAASAFASDLIQ